MKPRLLDAFCGAGGSAVGYHRAGFEVVGVDVNPMPNYPFEFHQADALMFIAAHGREFAAIHTSPPCQASTALTKGTNKGKVYPNLIPPTRELLAHFDVPTVIENVQGAKVRRDVTLCGEMFGLDVIRHRYFEINNATVTQPVHVKHRGRVAGWRHGKRYDGPYCAVYGNGGGKGSLDEWRDAMGIDWMQTKLEIAEAIPPAYTAFLGAALLRQLQGAA